MARADETKAMGKEHPWRTLWALTRSEGGRFALVTILAALGAAANLCEPLIYRVAVNDIAGVFVGRAATADEETGAIVLGHVPAAAKPVPAPAKPAPAPPPGKAASPAGKPAPQTKVQSSAKVAPQSAKHHPKTRHRKVKHTREPHRRGHVAPRTPHQMFVTLLWAVGLLFVTGLAAQLLDVLADNVAETAASRIEEDFITSTYARVLQLRLGFFARRATGALAKQIDQSDEVAPIVTAFAKDILPEAFRVLGTFAIMFTQSVQLTLVALLTVPAYLFVARRATLDLETNLPRYYDLWEQVASRIRDAIGAVKTVKLSGAEGREVSRLSASASAAYATYLARNRLGNRYLFLQSGIQRLGQALVLAYGGTRVLQHHLTPGDVVMFVTYLDKLYDPIDSLTTLAKTLQEHAVSLRRALVLRHVGDVEPGGQPLVAGPGRVEVRGLRFGYVPEREVLRGIDFVLEPGRVTALVGPSGAGKTTIVDLMLRLYDPTSGVILLDGQPLATIDPASLRRAVSVVSTDGAVFRGTLAENIRYKRPEATDAEVAAAARDAGLTRALERLPDGLATEIGEGGVGLSVGERQRLQIARALVSQPRILILDEATANLDYATELDVKAALEDMRRGRTTLIIAHRYSMVRDADHVVVIDAGRVVEEGAPADLLKSGGWFARLAAGAGDHVDNAAAALAHENGDGAFEDDETDVDDEDEAVDTVDD